MLRPLLALVTIALAAMLLAPTVASVHDGVTSLHIHRDLPWQLFKWSQPPAPPSILPPDCSPHHYQLEPIVTTWPARIAKNASFQVQGRVGSTAGGVGVPDITVEVFLNVTKTSPGEFLGRAVTDSGGIFTVETSVPHDLGADHYHVVAHALEHNVNCKHYDEGWSDPEMDVTAQTRILLGAPGRFVIGHQANVSGVVLDDVGAPVKGGLVNLTIDGATRVVRTDDSGAFTFTWRAAKAGNFTVHAEFGATRFYTSSKADSYVNIVGEDVVIDGHEDGSPLALTRSQAATFTGHVYLSQEIPRGAITLTFQGLPLAPMTVPQGPDGAFSFTLTALPPTATPTWSVAITGGGLKNAHAFTGTLTIPITLTVNASGNGLFSKSYHGSAQALDDAGKPAPGPLALATPDGWRTLSLDANGTALFQGKASCGRHPVVAYFNGTAPYATAVQGRDVSVCGYLAFLPTWLLGLPWWIWALAALFALLAWLLGRSLWQKHAPTLSRGPPLDLALARPDDDGPADIMGVGEEVLLVARLREPLPDGHSLRLGHARRLETRPLDGNEATLMVAPDSLGPLALRAEILDATGRVVTRRTLQLRVVRYAEEIETRYRALKRERLHDASEVVSPREFEAWLRANAPDGTLDDSTARRLVRLFEEADYSPRDAGRPEFLAFLAAERAVHPAKAIPLRKGVDARA